jgi:penicillin-binding protein 1A
MAEAMKGVKPVEFKVPEGMKLIAINRKTGMQATPGAAGSILEAFKPGTGPADSYWVIGENAADAVPVDAPAVKKAIESGSAGLY